MLHICTGHVAPPQRVAFVNSVVREWYGITLNWEADVQDAFDVEMSLIPLGENMLSIHRSSGARQVNCPRRPKDSGFRYFLHAAITGPQVLEVDSRIIRLEAGEFTVTDASRPCLREPGNEILVASLAVPQRVLHRYVPHPQDIVGTVFPNRGFASSISTLMRSMLEMERSHLQSAAGTRLALSVLDLFGLCSQSLCEPKAPLASGKAHEQLAHIKSYVNQNLHEAHLSVAAVAERFGISARYVQMLFARENLTLGAYIRTGRLERCRAQLADPAWRHTSISQIAFNWGFNDLSQFCRSFRRAFGVSARDYRRICAGQSEGAPSASAARSVQ